MNAHDTSHMSLDSERGIQPPRFRRARMDPGNQEAAALARGLRTPPAMTPHAKGGAR